MPHNYCKNKVMFINCMHRIKSEIPPEEGVKPPTEEGVPRHPEETGLPG